MLKKAQIEDILATRDNELLFDALWEDPEIVDKIRAKLSLVSISDIPYYHAHFCGGKHDELRE